MSIYAKYKAALKGETGEELSEQEFVSINGDLESLTQELNEIGAEIGKECELPVNSGSWGTRDLIIFLEAIEGQWYEQIYLKSLRGQQNLIEMLDTLESRV